MTESAERPMITQLRQIVEQTVAGGDVIVLEQFLFNLYRNVLHAIMLCQQNAVREPDKTAFHFANVVAYEQALDALEAMDDAADAEDWAALQTAMEAVVYTAREIDRLVVAT